MFWQKITQQLNFLYYNNLLSLISEVSTTTCTNLAKLQVSVHGCILILYVLF